MGKYIDDLKRWLDALPDQVDGVPCAVSDIGEPYEECFVAHLARPGDEDVIEGHVVEEMTRKISRLLNGRSGTIYWRQRLEVVIKEGYAVPKYDPDGPETDFVTQQRCFLDKNWTAIKLYCRFIRARHPTTKPKTAEKAA